MMDKELIIKKIDNLYTGIATLRQEVLTEFAIQYKDKSCPLGRLPICGMWSDREDIKDSVEWVSRLRRISKNVKRSLGLCEKLIETTILVDYFRKKQDAIGINLR